jgi:hypothetical protein
MFFVCVYVLRKYIIAIKIKWLRMEDMGNGVCDAFITLPAILRMS